MIAAVHALLAAGIAAAGIGTIIASIRVLRAERRSARIRQRIEAYTKAPR